MKPEPLKRKGKYCDGVSITRCDESDLYYHLDEDIRSAVEWLKTELDKRKPMSVNGLMETIDEAFQDVMKKEGEE